MNTYLGIGLGVPGVDYFTHWHVVKGKGDFQKTLERIGKQLGSTCKLSTF